MRKYLMPDGEQSGFPVRQVKTFSLTNGGASMRKPVAYLGGGACGHAPPPSESPKAFFDEIDC